MKFTVSQSSLAQALAIVSKGMGSNASQPIISGVHLIAENGTLELQTTDTTIFIRHSIPANVNEAGETVLSGKILMSIVKNLADAPISVEGDDHNVMIASGKSSFRLNALSPEDFPSFPEYEFENSVELDSDVLQTMVDKVYKVTYKDNSRPILSGILTTVEDNTIRLVATDSYRLAVCDTNVDTSNAEAFRAILPGSVFHEVLGLPGMTEKILIGITPSQVVFQFGNTTFIARKIEGNFPNYKQLLPKSCTTKVTVNVADLASSLRRVSVIALANPSVRFDIECDAKLMKLSATSPDQGDATEYVNIDAEGEDLSIALNYHYVNDCMNAVSDQDEITLELQSAMQPGIFKSYAKVNYLYLLMPVRM